jgi:hypothetical protein
MRGVYVRRYLLLLGAISAIISGGVTLAQADAITSFQGDAASDPKFSVTAINQTGMIVFDYEIRFLGTGGQFNAAVTLLKNDGPGGVTFTFSPGKDGYDLKWDDGGLKNNGIVEFTFFFTDLQLNSAVWTDLGMMGSGMTADATKDTTFAQIPAPQPSTVSLLAVGFLVTAVAARRRRVRSATNCGGIGAGWAG